jgi:4-coumarate--CoA ligase
MGTYIENVVEEHEHIFHSQYSPVPVPDNVTLPEFVLQNVEFYGDKVAFVDAESGKGVTYSEVARDIHRFSKALRSLGLRKGSVVIVVLPNVVEYAIVALGIMDSGGVFSGANPASHTSEIKKQVESADAKLIVTNSTTHEKVTPFTS